MRLSAAGQLHAGHRSPPQLEDLLLDALNGGANGAKVSVYAEVGGHASRCNAAITLR